MKKSAINKYLLNYAAAEIAQLPSIAFQQSDYCVVIPAYQETADFITQFITGVLATQNVLVVVVINQPTNALTGNSRNNTQRQLFHEICALGGIKKTTQQLTYLAFNEGNNHGLIVDRFSFPIPEKQGVGLARKIGCDIALALIAQQKIKSTFIASTDADATLPEDYFLVQAKLTSTLNPQQNIKQNHYSAAYFNFSHYSENSLVNKANQQYERALKYFYQGLCFAQSPYAFFTIGSILLINSEHYAQARGFPKRSAGEDFYLLNKLAKLGCVHYFSDSKVLLKARTSSRVPFGTGPAVKSILALNENNQPYCYYHPQVFNELKQLIIHAQHLFPFLNNIDAWLAQLSSSNQQALVDIGFHAFIDNHKKVKETQFYKQWLVWFDAFKTLKYIHALRHLAYPDIPLTTAMKQADFINNLEE